MKKIFLIFGLIFCACTLYATTAAKGVFSVSSTKTVQFANAKVATREATKNLYQWSEAVAMQEDGWILLSNDEWSYLLADGRTNASDLNSLGTINGENVLIILPDGWVKPEGVPDFSTTYMDDGFGANTYTTEQWTKMAESGAIYLPCGGYGHYDGGFVFDGNETIHGTFWTLTTKGEDEAYCMRFHDGYIHDQNYAAKTGYRSVILVREVTVLDEEHEAAAFATDLAAADDNDYALVNRTLVKDGTLYTLCLPFDVPDIEDSPLAGAEVFTFDGGSVSGSTGNESLHLNLSRLTGSRLTQGVPYLLRWSNTGETLATPLYFASVENWDTDTSPAESGNDDVKLRGIYPKTHIGDYATAEEAHYNFFLGANNTLYWPDRTGDEGAWATHDMKGFRTYFYIVHDDPAPAPNYRGMQAVWNISGGFGAATGIQNTDCFTDRVQTEKLMRDGQIVLVIDGKEYDLQGKQIK